MPATFVLYLKVNSVIAGFSAILVNVLLLFMVWFRSCGDLKIYRLFFIIQSFIDLFFTFFCMSTQLMFLVEDNMWVMVTAGIITRFGQKPSQLFLLIQDNFFLLEILVIPCTFIYRYLIFCRDRKLKRRHIVCMYTVVFFLILLMFGVCLSTAVHSSEYEKQQSKAIIRRVLGLDDPSEFTFLAASMSSATFRVSIWVGLLEVFISYAIVVFCSLQIITTMKTLILEHKLCRRTVDIQRQLTFVLAAQAVVPCVLYLFPMLTFAFSVVAGVNLGRISPALSGLLEWIPVFNSAITLLCVRPYRLGIKKFLMFRTLNTGSSLINSTSQVTGYVR